MYDKAYTDKMKQKTSEHQVVTLALTDVVTGKNARKPNHKSSRNINPTRNNYFSTGQTSSNVLFLAFNIR